IENSTKAVLSMNIPLKDKNGQVIAVLGLLADLRSISANMNSPDRSIFDKSQIFIINDSGVVVVNQNASYIGNNLQQINKDASAVQMIQAVKNRDSGIFEYYSVAGDKNIAYLKIITIARGSATFGVIAAAPESSVLAPVRELIFDIIIGVIITSIIIALFVFYYINVGV
ncbi:hypothetical protein, partial [Campylobacter porcelli]|nr:hypothetical protein [Campylobacter sp. CX2-4855-23]